MEVYCEKASELMGLSGNDIIQRMEPFCSGNSASEKKSWRNSLPKLISVIQSAELGNLYIAVEYKLPSGGRIDAALIGDDDKGNHHVLVVELKQWSKEGIEYFDGNGFPTIKVKAAEPYQSRHPVEQTKEYMDELEGNHSNVVNGRLSVFGCQYLHDFELAGKVFFKEKGYSGVDITKMYVKGEETDFAKYMKSIFSSTTDNQIARDLFVDGEFVMTEFDMEILNEITNRPENIPLWYDQSEIMDTVMPLLKKQAEGELKGNHMVLISGAAGTGKTIVGFRILAEYWKLHSGKLNQDNDRRRVYRCKYTLPRSRTIKQVLVGLSANANGIRPEFLDSITEHYDLLVIDEAHRITMFGNAMHSAQILIVLQDDRQRVRGDEIGTKEAFETFANKNGYICKPLSLNYQKRSGFGSYVDRLDKLLYNKEYEKDVGLGIDVTVFDDIQDLETWMKNRHRDTRSTKYYAPYCWEWKSRYQPSEIDIKIPSDNPVFQKQWNPVNDQYEWYLDSIDRVGCVYTAQGLGFDYVGYIWWDDLVWRTDHWEFNIKKIYDYLGISEDDDTDKKAVLLNIYRVMLTRAKKGIGIWFKDEETKRHFREVCLMEQSCNP